MLLLIIQELQAKAKALEDELKHNDINVFKYFFAPARLNEQGRTLETKYMKLFEIEQSFEKKVSLYSNLMNGAQFIQGTNTIEKIESHFKALRAGEKKLKLELKNLLSEELLAKEINETMKRNFEVYLEKDLVYFEFDNYDHANLQILFSCINDYYYLISRQYFLIKKDLLSFQAELQWEKGG